MTALNLLGLDIGERRIGVARVNMVAKLPEALATLINDDSFDARLYEFIEKYEIDGLVVGLPRNLSGEETAQTEYVKRFCQDYLLKLNIPIVYQDETLTTVKAQAELDNLKKGSATIDSMAAKLILEDYIRTNS